MPLKRDHFFLGAGGLAALGLASLGDASPTTVLSGHTLKAGHFLQPTAIAMGHKVIVVSFRDGG